MVVIGGSTAECYYLSDDKTWPYLLGEKLKKDFNDVWVNNAGFDGHSTFGHQILLEKYITKIKPKYVLFLVGINEIGRNDLNYGFDNRLLKNSYASWHDFIAKKSELANLVFNIIRSIKARQMGVGHQSLDFATIATKTIPEDQLSEFLAAEKANVMGYKARLEKLIETAKANGIKPILVTQPSILGEGTDPISGANLETIVVDEKRNGKLFWQQLELYNEQTKQTGSQMQVPVIDLARLMPKSVASFYDWGHFNNAGAEKVAEIIDQELVKYIKENNN